jgi:flavodoxin
MRRICCTAQLTPLLTVLAVVAVMVWLYRAGLTAPDTPSGKSILIVFHSGKPPWRKAALLDKTDVDALTQATTKTVNVDIIGQKIRDQLIAKGYRVDLRKATDVQGPQEFLDYDGLIFGTPTWFSNVAYPIKKLFDEHLIRVYEHRKGKMNDKVLSGFTTVMETGASGPNCLQCLKWGLEHLSRQVVEGVVINTDSNEAALNKAVEQFSTRFSQALK